MHLRKNLRRTALQLAGLQLCLLALRGFVPPSLAQPFRHPYPLVYAPLVEGERLEYEAGWNGIPAARASICVARDSEYPGLFRIAAEARSLGYVSLVWKMHDSWQTRVEAESYRPVSFTVSFHENDWVDIRRGVFRYAEHVLEVERRKKESVERYTIPVGTTYDVLTAAFLLRSIELRVGDRPEAEVCDGQGTYLVSMNVTGKDTIKIRVGAVPAYRMTVSIKKLYPQEGPVPGKKTFFGATLWIAADATRVPLRVESKLFVGSVYVELVSENRGLSAAYGRP